MKGSGIGDAISGTLGGAAAGEAFGVYSGYEESKDNRTKFASVLAETIKEDEAELQYIIRVQAEAKEAVRERGRQKLKENSAKKEEFRGMLADLYGRYLLCRKKFDMAKCEGQQCEYSPRTNRPCRKSLRRGTGIV